ncbi:hypothetical protein NUW58_g9822 [Xylaria curta]|uniref:Uncharacterized protein n=1 Tax=Xylaria curta TaxID=42375 RepID=A0ACC1MSN6_9PEZI|nr:hypothetical protein NUW58_g9822 [Xylaria curta]
MRLDNFLGAYQITFVDGLWIALVALEAGIILAVLGYQVVQARKRKARPSDLHARPADWISDRPGLDNLSTVARWTNAGELTSSGKRKVAGKMLHQPIGVAMQRAVGDDKNWGNELHRALRSADRPQSVAAPVPLSARLRVAKLRSSL